MTNEEIYNKIWRGGTDSQHWMNVCRAIDLARADEREKMKLSPPCPQEKQGMTEAEFEKAKMENFENTYE